MRTFENFNDYELIDADNGERLERWGDIILIRPDPQIIWNEGHRDSRWNNAHAVYHRSNSGGGYWEVLKKVPDVWSINYNKLTFIPISIDNIKSSIDDNIIGIYLEEEMIENKHKVYV